MLANEACDKIVDLIGILVAESKLQPTLLQIEAAFPISGISRLLGHAPAFLGAPITISSISIWLFSHCAPRIIVCCWLVRPDKITRVTRRVCSLVDTTAGLFRPACGKPDVRGPFGSITRGWLSVIPLKAADARGEQGRHRYATLAVLLVCFLFLARSASYHHTPRGLGVFVARAGNQTGLLSLRKAASALVLLRTVVNWTVAMARL
jgi:hypothetical protein